MTDSGSPPEPIDELELELAKLLADTFSQARSAFGAQPWDQRSPGGKSAWRVVACAAIEFLKPKADDQQVERLTRDC